jgi:hypothetical protein
MFPWEEKGQLKNLAWYLPRPKKNKYKGSMPLYCEEWLILLAEHLWYQKKKFTFPEKKPTILQVFSGVGQFGFRVDIKPECKPDLICDVHELTKHLKQTFDIILADPPYSDKESKELYNTKKLSYKKWYSECDSLLNVGGIFIVYHVVKMPNPDPQRYKTIKRVMILSAPMHKARIALYFQKIRNGVRDVIVSRCQTGFIE